MTRPSRTDGPTVSHEPDGSRTRVSPARDARARPAGVPLLRLVASAGDASEDDGASDLDVTTATGARHWPELALCRGLDVELFFSSLASTITEAKVICRRCPVRLPCLEHALGDPGLRGVWGGASEQDRQLQRRRSRPS